MQNIQLFYGGPVMLVVTCLFHKSIFVKNKLLFSKIYCLRVWKQTFRVHVVVGILAMDFQERQWHQRSNAKIWIVFYVLVNPLMPGGKKGTNTKPAAKRCQLKIFHRQFKFTVVFQRFWSQVQNLLFGRKAHSGWFWIIIMPQCLSEI